jgi:lipopolysaccharide transport system permease protein
VPFKWFTATLGDSTRSVIGKEGLIKQILFPKIILPVADAISQIVSFFFGMLVLFVLLVVAYRAHLTMEIAWVPVIAAVQFVFTLGFTFILAAITVFYRDVGIVIGHFMRLLFWISPILWSFTAVAGRGQDLEQAMTGVDKFLNLPIGTLFGILRYNPMSLLLESYRQVIYGHLQATEVGNRTELSWTPATAPDVTVLMVILVTGIVFLVIGTLIFKRLESAFAKVL